MQQYQFTCPLEGCTNKMVVSADNDKDAATKLTSIALEHVKEFHPEVQKTHDEAYQDIYSGMEIVDSNAPMRSM